jgi:hypothetical protein
MRVWCACFVGTWGLIMAAKKKAAKKKTAKKAKKK